MFLSFLFKFLIFSFNLVDCFGRCAKNIQLDLLLPLILKGRFLLNKCQVIFLSSESKTTLTRKLPYFNSQIRFQIILFVRFYSEHIISCKKKSMKIFQGYLIENHDVLLKMHQFWLSIIQRLNSSNKTEPIWLDYRVRHKFEKLIETWLTYLCVQTKW